MEPPIYYIIGVDECGWGAYAGPLTVGCAVYHGSAESHPKIKDCKRFSTHNALRLGVEAVKKTAIDYTVGAHLSAKTFDEFIAARDTLMTTLVQDAISNIRQRTGRSPSSGWYTIQVVVDGEDIPAGLVHSSMDLIDVVAMPKADSKCPAVSAASIVAKYLRDDYMINLSKKYPQEYKLESNKGYGTRDHILALKKYGALDIHHKYIHDVQQAIKEKGFWDGERTQGH